MLDCFLALPGYLPYNRKFLFLLHQQFSILINYSFSFWELGDDDVSMSVGYDKYNATTTAK